MGDANLDYPRGFTFEQVWAALMETRENIERTSRVRSDIDILLADTEWVMAVEVKRELHQEDVDHHIRRMELIRRYPPADFKPQEWHTDPEKS